MGKYLNVFFKLQLVLEVIASRDRRKKIMIAQPNRRILLQVVAVAIVAGALIVTRASSQPIVQMDGAQIISASR